jgi:hypothetical protein
MEYGVALVANAFTLWLYVNLATHLRSLSQLAWNQTNISLPQYSFQMGFFFLSCRDIPEERYQALNPIWVHLRATGSVTTNVNCNEEEHGWPSWPLIRTKRE